jgi:hypothetical protein
MPKKAMPDATECVAKKLKAEGRRLKIGSIKPAIAGSPTHPKAMLASVIPN